MKPRRYIKLHDTILCEFHCEVHRREPDYYEMGEAECGPDNWRNVYALGTRAEIDGY